MTVIQMNVKYFNQYSKSSNNLSYTEVPFSEVTKLMFDRSRCHEIVYQCGFEDDFHTAALSSKQKRETRKAADRNQSSQVQQIDEKCQAIFNQKLSLLKPPGKLSAEKVQDLKFMIDFMPQQDKEFYETLF